MEKIDYMKSTIEAKKLCWSGMIPTAHKDPN